ncbi:interleukin 21 receptor, tandem duplicate 1 [Poecilia formosa]|uniref:Interleukin-21 receptor-like n=1 Tax=Poecilia formosa TaxID=48698 RepID=A0A087XZG8_POEFO|nr:PREDICTED: interleukin-21 receptor-like [Poecilia formosa]XP_016536419.1 PREDICTED: interleukin-21 receptor-like [Poecilia formosa]
MAPPPLALLLLWGLTLLLVGAAASVCNVTCTTDYVKILNCSCSGSVPTLPVLLTVTCSSSYPDTELNVSCETKPPQSWCIINEDLTLVASIDTLCNATASRPGSRGLEVLSESLQWELSSVVKADTPDNVRVEKAAGIYNITWSNKSEYTPCITNKVRIRNKKNTSEDLIFTHLPDQMYFELDQKKLQPGASYVVDVKAKICDDSFIVGPWSEWSSGAEWSTPADPPDEKGVNFYWLYISTPIILILALLLLGYLQKPCWQKKLKMMTFIPRPNDYFKPLYHSHGGNFKEWVKPVFNEYDYLKITTCVMLSEKQSEILSWSNEKQSYSEVTEVKAADDFLQVQQLPNNLLMTFQDSSTSQGTIHSTGHISIHTVTLSGEEFEGDVTSQSSLKSFQDSESFGSLDDDNRERVTYNLGESHAARMERHSEISLRENQIANDLILENQNLLPDGEFNEAERVSLNSFASHEQSEDGYPHVDLDTIDSGFGECGSPGASDSNSNSFPEEKHLNSNYVKQWMICSTIQEDTSTVNNELDETVTAASGSQPQLQ